MNPTLTIRFSDWSSLKVLVTTKLFPQESDLSSKTKQLEVLRAKASETPPELASLRQELTEVKSKHAVDLRRAEQRSSEVEERAQQLRAAQEHRVVNLEARLHELSETVGSYDRLRQQDQNSIQKLRERVQQLDTEKNEGACVGPGVNFIKHYAPILVLQTPKLVFQPP